MTIENLRQLAEEAHKNKALILVHYHASDERIKFSFGHVSSVDDRFLVLVNNKKLRTWIIELISVISLQEVPDIQEEKT